MFLMFDTNVFVRDFYLRSLEFKKLFCNLEKLGILIFLNPYVIKETIVKYREKLLEYNLKTKNYHYLVPEYCSKIDDDEIEKMVAAYSDFINHQAWEKIKHNVKFSSFSLYDLNYTDLFERCLSKKKPFSFDGKGFKDTIIWASLKETAKTYLNPSQKFIFITDNYTDFCDEKPSPEGWYYLHSDLLNEMMDDREFQYLDIKHDTIRVYRSLSAFNSDILQERSKLSEQIIYELKNERYRELIDYISKELEKVIEFSNDEHQIKKQELIGINHVKPIDTYKTWIDNSDNLTVLVYLKYTVSSETDTAKEISVHEREISIYINPKDRSFEGLDID